MNKTLWIDLKSKFFVSRFFSYFIFFLTPIWESYSLKMPKLLNFVFILFYLKFIMDQFFLLGKEIDYRLKIYFKINSTIDKIIYRLLAGMVFFSLIYTFYSLFPSSIQLILFWVTWLILGLFYSWPTRGKIIQESMSNQYSEWFYLDRFEKTILVFSSVIFILSIPILPFLESFDAIKLLIDPHENISYPFWNLILFLFTPFINNPSLFRFGIHLFFYIFGVGIFLLCFYGFLRFYFSRKLSLLGVFALLSSWSYCLTLNDNQLVSFTTTFPILWLWSVMWCSQSSSYRVGLFMGLINFWSVLINKNFILFLPLQFLTVLFWGFKDQTRWFKIQYVKYTLIGLVLIVVLLTINSNISFDIFHIDNGNSNLFAEISTLILRKAFYSLSFLGPIFLIFYYLNILLKNKYGKLNLFWSLNRTNLLILFIITSLILNQLGFFFPIGKLYLISLIVIFALIPIEWIFNSLGQMRQKKNIIYGLYILICLLDSHFEGRIKQFIEIFKD